MRVTPPIAVIHRTQAMTVVQAMMVAVPPPPKRHFGCSPHSSLAGGDKDPLSLISSVEGLASER